MGSSFIDYQGRGFWARDAQVELWLHLLSTEADAAGTSPDWLEEAREDWRLQATAGFMGCVSPSLDRHLEDDPERVGAVLDLAMSVRRRLEDWSPAIPKDVASGFGTGGEDEYLTEDVDVSVMLRFADEFIGLLRDRPGTP